jgi:hypothetical protein
MSQDIAKMAADANYEAAQRRYDRELPQEFPEVEPDRLTPTLAMNLADWIEQGGRERLLGVVDLLIDELRMDLLADPVATLEHWVRGGNGPRDLNLTDFDCRR